MGGRNSGRKLNVEFEPSKDVDPWERQFKESDKAFHAFKTYRDLGLERTVVKTVGVLGKKPIYRRVCEQWSSRWGWRLRVTAWDAHKDKTEREAVLAEAEKKAKQKLGFAEGMWMTAARGLGMWNTYIAHHLKVQKGQLEEVAKVEQANSLLDDPDDHAPLPNVNEPPVSLGDIQRLADTGLKLTQLLEGKPTDIHEQRQQITIDERRKGIQELIHNKELRMAMKQVAKAMEGTPVADPDGGGNGRSGIVH